MPVATAVVLEVETLDASGNVLGQALLGPIDTTLSTIPTESVSVGGLPATIVLSPIGLSAGDDGSTHAITLDVSAQDASGNTIIPPGNYPNAIALSISGDTNHALSLSTSSVASPGPTNGATVVTLTYNSAIAISQATISATSGSISTSVPFAPIVFTPKSLPSLFVDGEMQMVTVSEAGYAGAFNVTGTSSTATVACVPANCTPASAGGAITVDVTPAGAGTETLSIVDSYGGIANLPITVTESGGGGEVVAPSYTIDKYPLPVPSDGPPQSYGIATGPDGQSLWIVDRGDQTVDVVASPGACTASCTAVNLPNGFINPGGTFEDLQSIVTASDGNLYLGDSGNFAQGDYGQLLELTGCNATSATCGAENVASYAGISTPAPGPLLAGPDGNLYAGSLNDNNDPSYYDWGAPIAISPIVGCCSFNFGGNTIFPPVASTATSTINGLTIDATGTALWFTDSGTGNIGFYSIPCEGQCTAVELPNGYNVNLVDDVARRHVFTTHEFATHVAKKVKHPYAQHMRRDLSPVLANTTALSSALNGIISGPDGYLYVADPGNHTIDQIDPNLWDGADDAGTPCYFIPFSGTPSPTTCEYVPIPLPQTSGTPMNLTVGPDGNVWFTDTTGYVGFVSLAACATSSGCKAFEYNVGGSPWGITTGSDGNIWFTLSTADGSGNNFGKVVL